MQEVTDEVIESISAAYKGVVRDSLVLWLKRRIIKLIFVSARKRRMVMAYKSISVEITQGL